MDIAEFKYGVYADIGGVSKSFMPFEEDTESDVQYFGFVSADDYWLIQKRNASGSTVEYTYCVGQGDHKAEFTDRASQTYVEFTEIGG